MKRNPQATVERQELRRGAPQKQRGEKGGPLFSVSKSRVSKKNHHGTVKKTIAFRETDQREGKRGVVAGRKDGKGM